MKIVFIINNIEYILYDFLMLYIDDNEIKYEKYRKEINYEISAGIEDYIININKHVFDNNIKLLNNINLKDTNYL